MDKRAVRKIRRAGYTIEAAVVSLPRIVKTHLRETGESPSSFGHRVLGDECFVLDLARGRQPRLPTIARVLEAIAASRKARLCASTSA